ncbi:unnamed protein product, partial [Polarella glacialis]
MMEEVGVMGSLTRSWQSKGAIVRCMRYLTGPDARDVMDDHQRLQVDEALDPPVGLIAAAGSVYALTFAGLRKPLRARQVLLQVLACGPAAAVLCLGGLYS